MAALTKQLMQEAFWAISADDATLLLRSSRSGITDEEAEERRKIFGENIIISKKRFTRLKIFLSQFKSPLVYILVVAGIVTLYLGEISESIFILVTVLINTSLGFYQENKAEKTLESLENYLERKTRVIRNGKAREIKIEELVPGDIVHFSSGDNIPADCRIIHSSNLAIDESMLTGESLPAEKNTEIVMLRSSVGDRNNMVFTGTSVVEGVGSAIVVSVGPETQLGGIAALVTDAKEVPTPLQKDIGAFANKLIKVLLALSLVVFILGLFYDYSILEMFKMSVAVAVAAVPEDLAISLVVVMAVGVERLAKRKGVVKRLLSAETLGSTSLILTDKTGTLTAAKMNFVRTETPFVNDAATFSQRENAILKFALLCTDAQVENYEAPKSEWKIIGKPLDIALVKGIADNSDININDLRNNVSFLERLPFTSLNKFSSVKVLEQGVEQILVIGAPEVVLKMSETFYWNGRLVITEDERDSILKNIQNNAYEGYRILSVAMTESNEALKEIKKIKNFSYLGNILLKDPVRNGIGAVIKEIDRQGIRTVMVTGDHVGTAISVARELGIVVTPKAVIEQHELDLMDDDELRTRLPDVRIFSRINPLSKVRIAKIFQSSGYTVAMVGDGVNDAPALKQADVGVAVGSGSGVAREAADLVLLDDSFRTIVYAIDEGRRILQNVRKVLVFCLIDLSDELLLVGGSIILNIPIPLTAMQILWVNFITDSLPTISLAYEDEATKTGVIRKRISRESIFDNEVKFLVWIVGTLTSIVLFALYYILRNLGFEMAVIKTFIFASFGIYTLLLIFSVRSLDKNIWEYNPFANRFTNFSSLIGLLFMLVAIYNPFLQKLLHTTPLPFVWIIGVALLSISCLALVELGKYFFIRRGKNANFVMA